MQPKAGRLVWTALAVVALLLCVWLASYHLFVGMSLFILPLALLWLTRRKITSVRLVIVGIIFLVVCLLESFVIYPVRVSFTFDYGEKHFETSYLTTVIMDLNNPLLSTIRWAHGRPHKSLALPDGSLVILAPKWPFEWQGFPSGTKYVSRGRWFWLDSAEAPQQIIYGDSATQRSPRRLGAAPFTWIDVSATIERVSEIFLSEALRNDSRPDAADRLAYSSLYGGSLKPSGILFEEFAITPMFGPDSPAAEQVERLKGVSGWIAASEDCRIKPVFRRDPSAVQLTVHSERIGLLREAATWTGDGGPRPGEPAVMYSTGKLVEGTISALFPGPPALKMVHSVRLDGQICSGIELPTDAVAEIIQFPNGKLILLSSSPEMVILKD
jgi:hypothetical protein